MRIAILHTRLSGYFTACLRDLKSRTGAELLIFAWPNQVDAPFDSSEFKNLGEVHNRKDLSSLEISAAIADFSPDVVLTSGWADKGYVKICRQLKAAGMPIIAGCDTQWRGSLRQHIASISSRYHVHRTFDILWVTGERQATLGRALGFSGDTLWDGYYACDWSKFSQAAPVRRSAEQDNSDPYFLYVGRYAPEKGVDTLATAYMQYREHTKNPWRLVCAGAGPMDKVLLDAGAENLGFIQPDTLPELMQGAEAFVLPSNFEPWGVVVQEAAASSLPLILSDAVGASAHLLRQGFNGFSFPGGSVDSLTARLLEMHQASSENRSLMGARSLSLSCQYTPQRWSETLTSGLRIMKRDKAGSELHV